MDGIFCCEVTVAYEGQKIVMCWWEVQFCHSVHKSSPCHSVHKSSPYSRPDWNALVQDWTLKVFRRGWERPGQTSG